MMKTISTQSKKRAALPRLGLMLAVMLALIAASTGLFYGKAAAADHLLYQLDFSDANAIGKNVASTDFADATLQSGATLSITNSVKGGKALNFVGGNDGKNYLSLPTAIFEGQNAVTLSGWFYVPHDIGDYIGEIGIYAPEDDATFRADPRASYHWDAYLYDVGKKKDIPGGSTCGVKPVYDAWYHMAYVIDGAAHTFTVIQNGAKVYEETLDSTFTPSQYHSATSHFYLGQSAYETGKDNYTGKMADFRVYGKALTAQEVVDAYALDVTDFKTAEYTFDNADNRYEDSVRGYDLQGFNGTPTFVDGGMRLEGGAAVQPYVRDNDNAANAKNIHFFDGHANLTVSMDLTVKSNEQWRRVMDMFAGDDNRITYMWHCPRAPGEVFDAVYHAKDAGSDADANDNNMIGDNSFAFRLNEKFNLTIVLSDDEITVWENGVQKVTGTVGNKPTFQKFLFDLASTNGANFTIGTCSYEKHNYIEADYDNIRIYAAAAETAEEVRAVRAGFSSWSVQYVANNGTTEKTETFVRKGADMEIAANEFIFDGHVFTGWNTAADGSGTAYAAGDSLTATADMILYARWQNAANYVTFDPNGGRGEMDRLTVPFGEEKALAACTFAQTGYSFIGWNTAADGSGTAYAADAKITPSGDVTLYAQWQAKTFQVTFDANGGAGTMEKQPRTFGTESALSSNAFTRHGYTFGGWALTATGIAVYTDGQAVAEIEEGNDVTLYAVWVLGTFSITFDANGGSGTMHVQNGAAFAAVALTENAFTFDGKIFQGWATAADGAVAYDDGDIVALENDVTLYAVWKDAEPDPTPTPEEPPKKGCGCGGNMAGVGMFGAAALLFGGALLVGLLCRRKTDRR